MGVVLSFTRVTPDELARLVDDRDGAGALLEEFEERADDVDGYLDKSAPALDHLLAAAGVNVELESGGEYSFTDGRFGWSAEYVRNLAAVLEATPFGVLAEHFDPGDLDRADVHPGGWTDGDLAYLEQFYQVAVDFFVAARRSGSAAVSTYG